MNKLLLHSCCGPCTTSVHEQIQDDFEITSFWFNPNIEPLKEHALRLAALKDYCVKKKIQLINFGLDYAAQNREFEISSKGLELEPEGGNRCLKCIGTRLEQTAKYAKEHGFDIFGTTLSVSPHKDAEMINTLGQAAASIYQIEFLPADFKKHGGYQRSIELSQEFNLYRQKYCGCRYSMR